VYREIKLDAGYRLDLLVEDLVIVEVKAVDSLAAIHQAKIISYLSLAGKSSESSLISTVSICGDGIRGVVNGL
jgi:GxxExxY protein